LYFKIESYLIEISMVEILHIQAFWYENLRRDEGNPTYAVPYFLVALASFDERIFSI